MKRGMPKNNKKTPSFAIKSRPPTIISHLVASMVNALDLNSTRGQSHMALAVPSSGDDPQWPTILCVNWEIVAWSGVNAMKGCAFMEYEWLRLCTNGCINGKGRNPFSNPWDDQLYQSNLSQLVWFDHINRVMMWWKYDYCQHNKQTNHVSKYNIYLYIYVYTSR